MSRPMGILEERVTAMRNAWAGALPAGAPTEGAEACAEAQRSAMSDAGLVRAAEAAGALGRAVDALLAGLAGEIARRSPREAGADGLARRQGYANPAQLVADATGGAFAGAARLVAVGTATVQRQAPTGEVLPPMHPHVAEALRSGSVSVDAAGAITGTLDRIAARAEPEDMNQIERLLAERAAALPLDRLGRTLKDVEARLDPEGVQPREEVLRAARALTLRQDGHGMLRISGALDPETGAPVMAALQGIVTHALRAARDTDDGTAGDPRDGTEPVDGRSIPRLQADALGMICRHALGCDGLPDAPATAVVVRIGMEALTEGIGHAEIDGLAQPVSAGTARRMAAAAGIIPVVLGTDSLPLDVGRAHRGFTPAQRIALAERDGGCARCGIDVPYTEAHHIKWWVRDHGRTDLTNGVLLCQPCHTRIHADGWTITANRDNVWFTPPPHIDPDQKRRLGGKARYRPTDELRRSHPGPARDSAAGDEHPLHPSRPESPRPPQRDRASTRPPGTPATPGEARRRSRVQFRE